MKRSNRMLRLFDFWRGSLPAQEAEQLEKQLAESDTLRREFDQSRQLFEALGTLAAEKPAADPVFSQDAMRSVRQQTYKMEESMWARSKSFVNPVVILTGLCALAMIAQSLRTEGTGLRFVPTVEGSAGALLMVFSGIIGILLATVGRFRQSAALVVIALALFSLRSLASTFFNDVYISDDSTGIQTASQNQGQQLKQEEGRSATILKGQPPSEAPRRKIQYNSSRVTEATNGLQKIPEVLFGRKPGVALEDRKVAAEAGAIGLSPGAAAPAPLSRSMSYTAADSVVMPIEDREGYGQYTENPRFDPAVTPLSTFSIDVDTGSYSNMRRFITRGQLPPKDSVRIEEYVNYFDYSYESSSTEPFAVNFEVAPSPLDPEYHLVRVGIKARTLPINSELGWNLVFLIDVSGSMNAPNKLPLVKESLKLLARNMRPIDRIALVTYAGSTGIVLEATPGNEKEKINAAIDSLGSGGGTNGSAGIELAYQVAQRGLIKGSVNRVVLATDGDFNIGTTSFDGLMKIVEERRKSGITMTTLGFGEGNYQEHSMEQLADRGNGNYFYIDSFREARKVLETGLASNMQIVAKDVKLQMEFNPAVVRQYRLIGFDNRKLNREDFTNDAKDAGEIGSGHTVTALYEVVLQDSPLAKKLSEELRYHQQKPAASPAAPVNTAELGFLKIRYKEPEAEVSTPLSFALNRNLIKGVNEASSDFKFAAAVAYFGEIMRQSEFLGNYSLDKVIALAKQNRGEDSSGNRAEFIKLAEDAGSLSKR